MATRPKIEEFFRVMQLKGGMQQMTDALPPEEGVSPREHESHNNRLLHALMQVCEGLFTDDEIDELIHLHQLPVMQKWYSPSVSELLARTYTRLDGREFEQSPLSRAQ